MNHSIIVFSCLIGFLVSPALSALPAHVHGKAKVQVAIEGNEIYLDFDSPLDNLLGFEHTPKNDQQREAVKAMVQKLRHPETLFVTPKAAACVAKSVNLTAPVLPSALLGSNSNPAATGEHKPEHNEASHAGLEAEILLQCANPAALKQIDVQLFKTFPLLQYLQAEMINEKGQSALELNATTHLLTW